MTETYQDPCPKCGARLVGFSKEEYIEHLRENGESLAADLTEELVVETEGFYQDWSVYDPDGVQRHSCDHCNEKVDHNVWCSMGAERRIEIRECQQCGCVSIPGGERYGRNQLGCYEG